MCIVKKFPKLTVSPHLALQHVKEIFPDMYSYSILTHKSPRTS